MFPILYDENSITYGSVPQHNGLGILSDALACNVVEKRNGSYELELTYPASGIHAKDIQIRHLIKAKPNFTDDEQLFRIYKIGKVLGSSFTVYARHISYDLSGVEITSGSAGSCVAACALLSTNDFSITTDKNVTASFKITEPSSRRSWLGGKAGSILDVFGTGEYHYNNFNIEFLLHRGTNRGVEIRYGKNLLSLSQDRDGSNLTTAIIVFWKDSETDEVVYSAKTSTGLTLDTEAVQCIDVSADFDEKPTVAQLNLKAQSYVQNHNYSIIKNSIKLNFLQIKSLKDRVDLCDEVKVYYEDFGIESTAECISTTWDVLQEQYTSIELGDLKANFADTFISTNKETRDIIGQTKTMLQIAIENATSLITGNEGGYVILHDSNDDGYPDEILIMNTDDINTATKVWRWNASGLGYSSTGYAGTYALAMTIDGQIVASFITTGTMSANRVRTGLLTDVSGNNYFDLDSGHAHFDSLEIEIGGTATDAATAISAAATAAANAQNTANSKVSPSEIRTKFAADNTSIDIQSGTIHFKSNTFLVDSTNLTIAADGSIWSSRFKANFSIETWNQFKTNKLVELGSYQSGGILNEVPTLKMWDMDGNLKLYIAASSSSQPNNAPLSMILYGRTEAGTRATLMNDSFTINPGSGYSYVTLSGSNGYGVLHLGTSTDGKISATGNDGKITCVSLTQTSTRKAKKNIEELGALEAKKVLQLRPVKFDFKDEVMGKDRRGLIAEDTYDIIPQIVTMNDGKAIGIDYIEIIPYLIAMLKLQQNDIEFLKRRVKNE